MNPNVRYTSTLAVLLLLFFPIFFIATAAGNPIPVYPNPEPVYYGSSDVSNLDITWIVVVFIIDFFVNMPILYGGIYLSHRYSLIKKRNVFDFSKRIFLTSVVIISLVGLISELVFGAWIGGLLLALLFIFLSFVLVSKYLLKLSWINGLFVGLFALLINIVVWFIIFTI